MLLVCAGLAGPVAPEVVAQQSSPWPLVSRVVTVTDRSLGHASPNGQYQTRPMVRVGNHLYFLYWRGNDPNDPTVYARKLDLADVSEHGFVGPTRRVFSYRQAVRGGKLHSNPSLARDAAGNVVALWAWGDVAPDRSTADGPALRCVTDPSSPTPAPCWGVAGRVMPALDDPSTWGGEGGIPSRLQNDFGWERCPLGGGAAWERCGAGMHDLTSVYDDHSGCGYFVGELVNTSQRYDHTFAGGYAAGGLPRGFYRVCGDARNRFAFDGPYMVVRADQHPKVALGSPSAYTAGNVFAKGDLRLGRETSGPRSLHLVWHKHVTMVIENAVEDASLACGDPGSDDDAVQWDWDVMYAVSTDGGRTWCNHARSKCVPEGMDWNDNEFRIWAGEVEETVAYAWDVDSSNQPVVLLSAWDGYPASFKGDPADPERYHLDWNACPADRKPGMNLKLLRYDGAADDWTTSNVETFAPYFPDVARSCEGACGRLQVAVAPQGDVYLFREGPPRYALSTDAGATFGDWIRFDDPSQHDASHRDEGWRVMAMRDSDEPGLVHVMYQSAGDEFDAESGAPVGNLYHYLNFRIGADTASTAKVAPPPPDADRDGVPDAGDNCPTVRNGPSESVDPVLGNQADRDADGVGDACDNCAALPNGRITALAFETTTGGQRDDDVDGYGNACDADFDNSGGSVDPADLALFKRAYYQRREVSVCGFTLTERCAPYDLDRIRNRIDSGDLTTFKKLYAKPPGPRCPACQPPFSPSLLACVGPACSP
jgi:hypothetical protein